MLKKNMKIIIKNFIENEYAHNPEDGEKISKIIRERFKGNSNLILDFTGVKSVNTAFINKIIYGLYESYSPDILNEYFKLKNCNELIIDTFKKVIENYKEVKNDLQ